jgi:hypothetical protein
MVPVAPDFTCLVRVYFIACPGPASLRPETPQNTYLRTLESKGILIHHRRHLLGIAAIHEVHVRPKHVPFFLLLYCSCLWVDTMPFKFPCLSRPSDSLSYLKLLLPQGFKLTRAEPTGVSTQFLDTQDEPFCRSSRRNCKGMRSAIL